MAFTGVIAEPEKRGEGRNASVLEKGQRERRNSVVGVDNRVKGDGRAHPTLCTNIPSPLNSEHKRGSGDLQSICTY
jgi:hypothetical protein